MYPCSFLDMASTLPDRSNIYDYSINPNIIPHTSWVFQCRWSFPHWAIVTYLPDPPSLICWRQFEYYRDLRHHVCTSWVSTHSCPPTTCANRCCHPTLMLFVFPCPWVHPWDCPSHSPIWISGHRRLGIVVPNKPDQSNGASTGHCVAPQLVVLPTYGDRNSIP